MNREQILQILYDMALITGSETRVDKLICKTLQRFLYHTAFPCGLFISEIEFQPDESKVSLLLEQIIGCSALLSHKGRKLSVDRSFLDNDEILLSQIKSNLAENIKYRSVLRLPINKQAQFILLATDESENILPFARIFEPVLTNFGKTLELCRKNEHYTTQLHEEIERRTLLEMSVRESEIRHRKVLEATVDGIITTDHDGLIESVNPAIEKLFGYSSDELTGQPVNILFAESFSSFHNMEIFNFNNIKKPGCAYNGQELFAQKKDGDIFPVEIAFSKMVINDATLFTGLIRNISERKRHEQDLLHAKELAERANRAKSEFLSSMSHELRTPLNAILGFAQLIEFDHSLDELHKDNLKEIIKAGNHLLELINEVLDLSKIESGHINMSLEPIDYNELISDCINLVDPLAIRNDIQLIVEKPLIHNPFFRADRTRIKQVLVNLLSNAIKYNKPFGSVTIILEKADDNFYKISVSDTGEGITKDKLDQLFMPFNRLDAEHSNIEGTGIGLVITKKLVELMGGKIGVKSARGKGTTFWINLPIQAQLEGEPGYEQKNNTSHTRLPVPASNEKTILYIEDNPVNLKLVSQLLSHNPEIRLLTAHTPFLGLELAEIRKPDLILLDIQLPEMDGFKVIKQLKNNDVTQRIPVIGVSANAMPNDIKNAKLAGFDDYLTKPLDLKIFTKTISAFLPN